MGTRSESQSPRARSRGAQSALPGSVASDSTAHRLLCRILRGERPAWPAAADAAFERRFLDACHAHGVAVLVHRQARSAAALHDWPERVRAALAREATMQAALAMLREQELIAVLEALAASGVETVLLKGTPLAYSHYTEPAARPRCDTDLLVSPAGRDAAARVLEAGGYRRANAVSGKLISYQDCFAKATGTVAHVVDLHWQVNNSQVFAQALGFDVARARAVAVPQLGESARALCPPHAMLLACMHRAAHLHADGGDGNRLIWLYDIHLLASGLSAEEWRQVGALCAATRMRSIALDAFAATQRALGTTFPEAVMAQLAAPGRAEPSAAYLEASRWRVLLTDLRALGTWRLRASLLRESCLPPAEYVMARYRARSRWLLPWWYARRALAGARKFSARRHAPPAQESGGDPS